MKSTWPLFALLVAGSLTACIANPPKPDEIRAADFGPKISKAQMTEAVKNYMSPQLKDPDGAKYSCQNPEKGWVVAAGKTYYGYASNCTINAKNSFGGYTGNEEYAFMIFMERGESKIVRFNGYQAKGAVQ